jgi:hypothetical protein
MVELISKCILIIFIVAALVYAANILDSKFLELLQKMIKTDRNNPGYNDKTRF